MIGRVTGMEDILSALESNADFYILLASLIFKKPYEDINKEERTSAKQRFWYMVTGGRKKGVGENHLGRLLILVRDELKEGIV